MVLALVGVRKTLELIFTKHELSELDDIMPEFHRKEEAEKLVGEPTSAECGPDKKVRLTNRWGMFLYISVFDHNVTKI